MNFSYLALQAKAPIVSLGGALVRHRPVISVRLFGPIGSRFFDGCVDSGSDDTIFPLFLARTLGIDLTGAPGGESLSVAGAVPYVYAWVPMRISDGLESCEWNAMVGFIDRPLRWALLGHAGFLEFFDTDLRGARREMSINPNSRFPGTRTVRQSSP